MELGSFRVAHLRKTGEAIKPPFQVSGSFFLDTCQRWLWICDEAILRRANLPANTDLEIFSGTDAYRFLLSVATGLESQIVGETDIFGQIKEVWKTDNSLSDEFREGCGPWMQRVFEDTKEIRSRCLEHLGGASYGSLVRRLLKDARTSMQGPILLVGAGQLAKSVAPYLLDQDLWVWNRGSGNLFELLREMESKKHTGKLIVQEDELVAWRGAAHVVVCIPSDEVRESQRLQAWLENQNSENGMVIHLGALREQTAIWARISGFRSLSDVFELERSQNQTRSLQIMQAKKACEERAKLRSLGSSVSIPHGWEDLAVFA